MPAIRSAHCQGAVSGRDGRLVPRRSDPALRAEQTVDVSPPLARSASHRLVTLFVVALCATWWALAGTVAAHATLVEMSPGAEERLDAPPSELRLTFSEQIAATSDSIRVFDPSSRELSGIEAVASGAVLTAALPDISEQGSYTVSWKVVSADGHALRGGYLFHVGEATLREPVDAGDGDGSLLADSLRGLGAVLALGGLVLCVVAALVSPRDDWSAIWRFRWGIVLVGTVVGFVGSVVAVPTAASESIRVVLQTTSGRSSMVAVLLAVAGLAATFLPVHRRSELVVAAATVPAVALQGHAVALDPIALSAGATVLHVVAAVGWGVGLLRMERRTRTLDDDQVRADARRFGRWGVASVVVLLVTGVALVLDRVPSEGRFDATYARVALVKVALLVGAVAVAARNRAVGRSEEPRPVAALRAGLRLEMVVLALALLSGAALGQIPPPGQEIGATAGDHFAERETFGEGEVEVTVEPGRRGMNEVHVTALGPDGRLMSEAGELELSFELESEGVGPILPDMQFISGGHSMTYARLPFSGTWTATVRARVDRFTELAATFDVPVAD